MMSSVPQCARTQTGRLDVQRQPRLANQWRKITSSGAIDSACVASLLRIVRENEGIEMEFRFIEAQKVTPGVAVAARGRGPVVPNSREHGVGSLRFSTRCCREGTQRR